MLRSFRSQLTVGYALGVLGIVAILSVGLSFLASRNALRNQTQILETMGRSTATMLADGMAERMREVELMARAQASLRPSQWRLLFEDLQRTRRHFSWIGLTDAQGRVVAASQDMLTGRTVAERPWFKAALAGPYAGDVHPAKLLAGMLPRAADGEPARFVDFAAPLQGADGALSGVLGVHLNWDWARDVIAGPRGSNTPVNGIEVFILDRSGEAILRPVGVSTSSHPVPLAALQPGAATLVWDDGESYLTAAVRLPARGPLTDMGWTVVTRQSLETALQPAHRARDATLLVGGISALLASLLAWLIAGRIAEPLRHIAAAARKLQAGQLDTRIPLLEGSVEVRDLSAALHQMTATLVERERALLHANQTLERRVAERTAELTRASDALRSANGELEKLATRDALTGLPNRRRCDEVLRDEMLRHARTGQPLAVVLADVDRFKAINDNHGHAAGDVVLRDVATALAGACRATDFVGRYGGEEFLVVMPETSLAGARVACEKLRSTIAAMSGAVPVTASFGLVVPAQRFESPGDALEGADQALYLAKDQGRNRVCVYDVHTPRQALESGFGAFDGDDVEQESSLA
ncbi:sensor domain-containing diguanylate cyclase [Piscinibacter koreensis]|uniref:diguanylate cyclase n=1 Tax=Piscinibacter koreensis TaxID=2742824 RepID=A0A7Y6NNW5_9BURK|nr:sensor domain-containing diguanylate cyclase [Schlegelella koreensis]NUZ06579.1 diguanylate cyclase [Schlegelella koreensis]